MRYALCSLLFLAGCGGNPGPGAAVPRADREGASWTHKELLAHLKAKGLKLEMMGGGIEGEPTALFVGPDQFMASVTLKATPQVAAEAAGPWGPSALAWGRFVFLTGRVGDPPHPLLSRIRKALAPAGD